MKGCILVVITFCLFGCNKEDPGPVNQRTPDSTVHLAGDPGGGSYWKNGAHSPLDMYVTSMSVDDSLVLVGGKRHGRDVIWQNNKQIIVDEDSLGGGITLVVSRNNNLFCVWSFSGEWALYKDGVNTPISPTGWPTAMALLGEDVYISGSSQGNEYPWMVSPFYPLDTYAICWKNDQEIFRETVNSYANTIFIYEDDIYLGGHLNRYPSLDKIACYWKNGQRFTLTGEDQDAEVRAMFVTDTHVYMAGVINGQAVYWMDGVVTFLSTGGISSKANSISVLGTDVYVAGQEDKFPAVWKNGVKQNLPNPDMQGEIKVVVAVSN